MNSRKFIGALLTLTLTGLLHLHAQTNLTQQILHMRTFREGLVLTGTNLPTEMENKKLLEVLTHLQDPWWRSGLEQFLFDYPDSPWAASLRYDYASFCRRTGRTTKALENFEEAWELVKDDHTPNGQHLGGAILGHWIDLLSSLGRLDTLKELISVGNRWHFINPRDRDLFQGAKDAYYLMRDHPAIAYRCGTFALKAVGEELQPTNRSLESLVEVPSPTNGFSMAILMDLAKKYGLNLVPLRRATGQELVVPSIVHWRQNHYAAILQKKDDLYLVSDPTFQQSQWMPADVINEEASGEFLIPAASQPRGWKRLALNEMEKIHGMGLKNNINDANDRSCNTAFGSSQPKCTHCPQKGMPTWWVSEPYINLWLQDEPISYLTSKGEPFPFQITFKQRDMREVAFPEDQFLEKNWNNSWFSYVTIYALQPCTKCDFAGSGTMTLYLPNGGAVNFSDTKLYDPETHLQLQGRFGGIQYGTAVYANGLQIVHPNGALDVYGVVNSLILNGDYPQSDYLLTQHIDPHGNTTWFNYGVTNGLNVLQQVIDYNGMTNNLYYSSSGLLTEVVNPYGSTAKFTYDFASNPDGILTNITDAQGVSSRIKYDTNGYPTSLITPYGTTTFSLANNGLTYGITNEFGNAGGDDNGLIDRSALVVDPMGATNLYMYRYDAEMVMPYTNFATGVPTNTPLGTLDTGESPNSGTNGQVWFRNSFYWGPMQYAHLSTLSMTNFSQNDYVLARMQHWLQDTNQLYLTAHLSVEREPSPDGLNPGLLTFYDYQGKTYTDQEGTYPIPSVRAWQLPDGSTHYDYLNFDYFGNITSWVSTYSLPNGAFGTRTNSFIYSDNTYTETAGIWNGSGISAPISASYTIPNLLTEIIGPDGNPLWNCGGFDPVSETNYWVDYQGGGLQTTYATISSWSRVLPDYITNGLGQIATFSYTPVSQSEIIMWGVTNGWVPANSWLGMDQIASRISFTGLTTTNIYDANGFLVQTVDEQIGRTNSFSYTTNGLIGSWTNELGLNVALTWDNLSDLTGIYFPDGTFDFIYYSPTNAPLDPSVIYDRLGNPTTFHYDGDRHLSSIANARSAVTTFDWCGCGALTGVIDALTNQTGLTYDNQGNLTNVSYPDGTSLTYSYDSAERMTSVTDASGRELKFGYNNQGLITTVSNANGLLQSVVYDIKDRPIQITDANGVTVTNGYDAIDELLSRTWPDGIGETFGYSAAGLVAYTNRDGRVTQYGLDPAGRLIAVTNANKEVVQFVYNPSGEIIAMTNGLNKTTRWQFNAYGWLTNKMDALGRNALQLAYNPDGWITNRWTPEKGNTAYNYDSVGNLKSITCPDFTNTYAYDPINELTNMTDRVGATAFSYTPMGQLQSETGPWPADTITNLYSQGLRTSLSLTEPSGSWSQSYSYDFGWRMTNVSSPAGAFGYNYNLGPASSFVSGITLPNGAGIANQYDSLARLTGTILTNHWGHVLDGYSYIPDPLGLRTNILRNLGLTSSSVSVGYDNIGQLIGWFAKETNGISRMNEQLAFGFDSADNLHFRTNGLMGQTFTVDAANQLSNVSRAGTFTFSGATPAPATNITVNGITAQTYGDFTFATTNLSPSDGNNNFTSIARNVYGVTVTSTFTVNLPSSVMLSYDNNGNLTNDGARAFSYDPENRLTNVTVAGQWRSDFVYDGLGRRRIVREYAWAGGWLKTNEIRIVYDGYLPLQERDSNNNVVVTYTRGLDLSGSLHGAGGIGGLLARTDSNGSTFYHGDGAGNVTALMDGQENIVARYMYGPFGKLVGQWGTMAGANEMQFSSMPRESPSGLSLYPFRAYEPNFQRWVNQDPIQERGGINLYRAILNNPSYYFDPLGFQSAVVEGGEEGGETGPSLSEMASENNGSLEQARAELIELNAGDEDRREMGLDPNQSYFLSQNPPSPQPLTEDQFEQEVKNAADDAAESAEEGKKLLNPDPCPPKGGVYALVDPESGRVMRTGRTRNLKTRQGQHARDPRFGDFDFKTLYPTDAYAEQRGLEQIAHEQYNPPFNYINPISPGNLNSIGYMSAAQEYLDSQ